MSNEEVIRILEDVKEEFIKCDGGSSQFIFKEKTYETDTGYAIEGIEFFIDRVKMKLNH